MPAMDHMTPMMRQYHDVKKNYPDMLVFYRLGDFYELFFDDAKVASEVLDLTLTRRGTQGGEPIPMAGIPYHAADSYIARLIKAGHSIVICEQMSDKSGASRNMIDRKVTKIITPGTVTDDSMLSDRTDTFIASIFEQKGVFGFATLNLTTGRFTTAQASKLEDLLLLLDKVSPAELLYPENFKHLEQIQHLPCIKALPGWDFDHESAQNALCQQFKTQSLNGFGVSNLNQGICAAGALLKYVMTTQKVNLEHITNLSIEETSSFVILDRNAQRNLELFASLNGESKGSLLNVIDQTCTAMGSRLLRNLLASPTRDNDEINARLDLLEALMHTPQQEGLIENLQAFGDIERIVARIGLRSVKPRDLSKLRDALAIVPSIVHHLTAWKVEEGPEQERHSYFAKLLKAHAKHIPNVKALSELLHKAIAEFPALLVRDGGVINEGYSDELDELRDLQNGAENTLKAIEERERERTKIANLKVSYNNIHGYYIEISKAAAAMAPEDYIRRQTLKNAERFITPELKVLEEKTLAAQNRCLQLEKELYDSLVEELITHLGDLCSLTQSLSHIDVSLGLARVAKRLHYNRPEVVSDDRIIIEGGRHAVVEALNDQQFIANSLTLNSSRNLAVISGPNMGGKSTYMRQNALIAILARIGSFVPADKAIIGDIDRIFTRIGASDDLASGRSTFMVEMEETATILNNATAKSLVIMDEVGRGTSGSEGAAIAEAIVQYLAKEVCPRTMFATHYTEVTTLVENYPNAFNLCFNAKEYNGKIIFLYHAEQGRQTRSYGIEVAQLAGVPSKITKRALGFYRARTKELDSANLFTPPLLAQENFGHDVVSGTSAENANLEGELIEAKAKVAEYEAELAISQELRQVLSNLDLNSLTPIDALNTLSQLKDMVSVKAN